MPNTNVIIIEHPEVIRRDLTKVEQLFHIKDDTETIKKALDMASSKIVFKFLSVPVFLQKEVFNDQKN